MDRIVVNNRAIIFRATLPITNIDRDYDLRNIEVDFKVATKFDIEITIGDNPRSPSTTDLFCKVIYNNYQAVNNDVPFTIDTMKMALLSVLRTYFHDETNGRKPINLQDS